jgi:hypothetical protein
LIHICGRKVKVQTGSKSQTVNICDEQNIHGRYDCIVRLQPPFISEDVLLRQCFKSIEDLVRYLEHDYAGQVERTPGNRLLESGITQCECVQALRTPLQSRVANPIPSIPGGSAWEQSAKLAVEKSIDQFILEFIEFPYLHRVEHSVHCELFRILTSHKMFSRTYPMGRWESQTVHKEWPEFLPRPENGSRRGNFDIAILSPDHLRAATFADFRQGRIEPIVAIEVGLDYSLRNHLQPDVAKLKNSGIGNSYLIHLVRQDCDDDFEAVERFVTACEIKTAYARVTSSKAFYKLVNDDHISVTESTPGGSI